MFKAAGETSVRQGSPSNGGNLPEELPVAFSTESRFLVTTQGDPVWPLRTPDELLELTRVTQLFGGHVKTVAARPGNTAPATEEVIGLGSDVHQAAKLYAHLTRRSVRLIEDAEQLHVSAGAVLVTSTRRLTFELLEQLYDDDGHVSVPGIVCAPSERSLFRQVLLRSAASVLCGPVAAPQIDIIPIRSVARVSEAERELLGHDASVADLRAAMSSGAGLLNILTHSDGIDAFFGKATLCPMDRWQIGAVPNHDLPKCVVRGICHRHNISLEEAAHAPFLIRPHEVAARVLILNTCRGVLPEGSLENPQWGFLPHILDSPTIGAVATTWELAFGEPRDSYAISGSLSRGIPIGEALAGFLRSPAVRQRGLRMCLFGDPRVRLPGFVRPKPTQRRVKSMANRQKDLSNNDLSNITFLRAYLSLQKLSSPPQLEPFSERAEAAVEDYERTAKTGGTLEDELQAPGPIMREALLEFLCRRGSRPSADWNQIASIVRTQPSQRPCSNCGRATATSILTVHVAGAGERHLVNCPRCGFVEDAPSEFPEVELRLSNGIVRLDGDLPLQHWSAALLLDPGLDVSESPERCWWWWPAAADGKPAQFFEAAFEWQPWPMNLTLFLIWRSQLAAITWNARRSTAIGAQFSRLQ